MDRKPTYEELEQKIRDFEENSARRSRAKGALRKYDLIFSAIQDPMAYIDRDYTCLAVNDVFLRMFNKSRQEIVGHSLEFLLGRKTFEKKAKEHLDKCLLGEESTFEEWVEYPTSGRHYLVMNFYPYVEDDGSVSGIAVVAKDITTHKWDQLELQKARDDLEKQVQQRTSELMRVNEQLRKENQERSRIEEALRQSEEMLRSQYRGIPIPTFTWKKSGDDFVLVDYNKATEDFTQGLIPQFIGRTLSDVYHDRPDIIQDIVISFAQTRTIRREFLYRMFTTEEEKYIAFTSSYVPSDMVLVHMEDITESKRSRENLLRSEKNLRILSSQLITAKEEERKRISHELHDSVGQYLSSIKFNLENIIGRMERGSSESGLASLRESIPVIQATIEEVRRISMDLRPSILDDLGILATISWFCREFQSVYTRITINRTISLEEEDVPEHLKIIIFRIIQEALNNVAKHSRADTVDLSLIKRDSGIELTISDNGLGFDVQEAALRENSSRGMGIASMEERTDLSGGCFTIDSVKGVGTLIMSTWRVS
ncbi:MAG TPA: PAS domain-containing protein [Deltaproteobacteria bacterium]|nr:PAS domain-containing protein [Deltaproteobacteria bacterium]HXK47616.1 PAS domain-containing protein [Deltaproteobacteria bacterium]